MAKLGMLIDLTRCIGCDACTVACKQENGTPQDVFFARVLNIEAGTYPDVRRVYLPVLCNHCENPSCLKACPNKAIFKRDDGIVLIDQERCRGTGACVSACPYGNIILSEQTEWYLPEDRAYERDYVRPRLKDNVARKCTFCAQRVDVGLDPACVVACPTTARIFGDLDDPESKISRYVSDQEELTGREPFHLLPEAGTTPTNMYLGTMAAQQVSTLGGAAEPQVTGEPTINVARATMNVEPSSPQTTPELQPEAAHSGNGSGNGSQTKPPIAPEAPELVSEGHWAEGHLAKNFSSSPTEPERPMAKTTDDNPPHKTVTEITRTVGALLLAALLFAAPRVQAQTPDTRHTPAAGATEIHFAREQPADSDSAREIWSASSCTGCHGANAMGGFGPPLAETKLTLPEFEKTVREGKGMMPATPESEVPKTEIAAIHQLAQATKLDPSQIPIAYKVSKLFSLRNVGIGFSIIGTLSLLLVLKVLLYWINLTGWKQLKPYLGKFGYGRAAWVMLRSLIVDGLLVASLWRKSKFRWAMHGLLLYGFLGLGLGDMLMSIFNPLRSEIPLTHPLKLLPNIAGLAVLCGIVYVRIRYSKDEYIDNGLTIGRDYLFLNLLTLSILSGFVTEGLGYAGAIAWVLPLYMFHLAVIATLMLSAPFTRFNHVFVVPVMVAFTRLNEALIASRLIPGFVNEPSPGRHHKSERIAEGLIKALDPDFNGKIRLRYYP